jgi:hypothetical protein
MTIPALATADLAGRPETSALPLAVLVEMVLISVPLVAVEMYARTDRGGAENSSQGAAGTMST